MTGLLNIRGHHVLPFMVTSLLVGLLAPSYAREYSPFHKAEAARHMWESQTSNTITVMHSAHNRGNIQLGLANNGTFGTFGQAIPDPFTGEMIPSCEYPRNSDITYLWVGAFWIGAVVGRDTLVSCGSEDFYNTSEFWPDLPILGGDFTYSSIDISSKMYDPNIPAYSEEDIFCEYYDTVTDPNLVGRDETDGRVHIPLGIKIRQRSMAWSYDYTDDFVLFDYKIENIGDERLRDVYIAIWIDGDAFHMTRNNPVGWNDDIAGFYRYHPAPEGYGFIDTVNIAYHGDNDGDPIPEDNPSRWDYRSTKSVVGIRVVRTPSDSLKYSYNWWIMNYSDASRDFGPRRQGTLGNPFRHLGSRLGTPEGDLSKYYVMSHEEFDYDLIWTAVNHTLDGWLPPPPEAEEFATGFDCRYLLSFGPFSIESGQTLPVTFAWVGGEDFHQGPTDFVNLWDPRHPERYYSSLDFSNLALNARWASWVYDNPGVDTDGDGYRGKFRTPPDSTDQASPDSAATDTFWYEGDGVPDFRGAGPPPAPRLRVIPAPGKLTIRWNGYYSENTKDVFTNRVDFEGYRVYAGLDDRSSSFSLLSSYDRENYSRFVWQNLGGQNRWNRDEVPYTLGQLREMYGDPEFDPLVYTRANPFNFEGEFHYFRKQDFNQSDLSDPNGIRKVDGTVTNPGTDSSLWEDDDLVFDYGEPLPKYYEYEYVLTDLLPTVPYYVAVTTFDFGSPNSGLASLETNPLNNCIVEFPQNPADSVEAHQLDAFVYPNPYRMDARYAARGFENRGRSRAPERARLIHFSNLPRACKISIFSLDGDLVREIDHNFPEGSPGAMHDTWDLITRNTQSVVSGIYYWVVESEGRTQIGKLAIIK